jgi:hypothetical protein
MSNQQTDSSSSDWPKDKAELLELIEQARRPLEEALSHLNEAQLTTLKDEQGWSVKDHLAHLAAWERGMVDLLQYRPRYKAMGLDREGWLNTSNVDERNDSIYRQNKERPLAEVMAAFQEAHRQMLAVLDKLTYEDLLKTYSHYQPDEPGRESGDPILRWVLGNTAEHYAEHLDWIQGLVKRDETGS